MLDTVLRKVGEWPKKNPAGFERDVVRAARRVVGSVSRGSRPTFDISGKSVPWCRAGGSATWPPGSRRERGTLDNEVSPQGSPFAASRPRQTPDPIPDLDNEALAPQRWMRRGDLTAVPTRRGQPPLDGDLGPCNPLHCTCSPWASSTGGVVHDALHNAHRGELRGSGR